MLHDTEVEKREQGINLKCDKTEIFGNIQQLKKYGLKSHFLFWMLDMRSDTVHKFYIFVTTE